jgi:hypothetical protein
MRTGLASQDARDDFDRARRRAHWAQLTGWLHGRPPGRLSVLGEVMTTGTARPAVRRLEYERTGACGPVAGTLVPIDQIVGTIEPTKYFDRRFRPTSQVPRARFEWIDGEIRSGRGMDPVDLYRCGGQYYVLDGRHRIAVARALGERSILANITEVRLTCPRAPTITPQAATLSCGPAPVPVPCEAAPGHLPSRAEAIVSHRCACLVTCHAPRSQETGPFGPVPIEQAIGDAMGPGASTEAASGARPGARLQSAAAARARAHQLSPWSSPPLTAEPLEVTTGDGRAGLPPLAVLALPGAPGVTVVVAGTAGWGWCAK